jgi:hypothetical protein
MINKLRPYDEFLICSSLFQPSLDTLFVLDWLSVLIQDSYYYSKDRNMLAHARPTFWACWAG